MRKLTAFEQYPLASDCNIQLAFRLATKKDVDEVAKLLQEKAIGCRCGSDGKRIWPLKDHVPIQTIPNFEKMDEASVYVSVNRKPRPEDGLAVVCVNDDTVVLNTNHMCADGGQFLELNKIILGKSTLPDRHLETPIPVEHAFLDDVLSTFGPPGTESTEIKQDKSKYKRPDPEMLVSHFRFVTDFKSFKCFDKKLNKPVNLTDHLWASLVLSASAHNNEIDKFGAITCVNLRPLVKDLSLDNATTFAQITQSVPMQDWNETIQSVCKRFRQKFNDSKEDLFRNIKFGNNDINANYNDNFGLELSNIGTLEAKGPIKDAYIGLTEQERGCCSQVCLLTYTVEKEDRTDWVGQFRYPITRMTPHEASKFSGSIKYFMQNIPLSSTIKEAVTALREYQQNFTTFN